MGVGWKNKSRFLLNSSTGPAVSIYTKDGSILTLLSGFTILYILYFKFLKLVLVLAGFDNENVSLDLSELKVA